jgi:predicted ATPase/Tfp pilus assembly protein PilF
MQKDPELNKRSVLIRTPDHHLRVFVSSTLKELATERKAVHQAISKLRLAPVMFESGARPHPANELYQAYLSQSHIFIGIYWQSYGWVAPEMEISGLEDEYNRSAGMPRLIYLKTPAPNQDPALKHMLERIRDENGSSYKYFSSTKELSELIEDDLILLLTEYFETARAEALTDQGLSASTVTNVPIPRNSLIGREQELDLACRLLQRQDVALVTLTGPAGTGKSRLAIQVALELRDQFDDGVYLVGLEAIRDPTLVIPAIAKTLNLPEVGGKASIVERLDAYLCAKKMLLLLDNFEQVLPAAPQVAELLEACPMVKVLVTSRASLHLRPEKELPIPPLKVPPFMEVPGLQPLSQYSAVELFIQRCQAVKPDFKVTNENAPAVAEICQRLDGLPLAIELAAARIKLLTPQALLARLNKRFDVLRGGTIDLPARQQTMYSAIDWSYSLLDDTDQKLFSRLAVFNGGWTVDAAVAVCDLEGAGRAEILDRLEQLVDNNLFQPGEEKCGENRLKMLESIREFAQEHLNLSGEAEAVQSRYVDYYLSFAQQAEAALQGPSQQAWHEQVDAELDNLQGVMAWAIENHENEIALRITMSIWRFWWTHGFWRDGFRWLKAGLDGEDDLPIELRAKALTQVGWYLCSMGEFSEAIEVLQKCVALWKQTDNLKGLAMALRNMGASILRKGDVEGSRKYLERAMKISRQQGDQTGTYLSLEIMGHAASKLGSSEQAVEYYQKSLALAQETNDDDEAAKLLSDLGDEYVIQGKFNLAEDFFNRSAEICKKQKNRIVGAYVSGNRSIIALKMGNYPQAYGMLVETVNTLKELGDKESTILCLEPFAYIARELSNPTRATRLFGASETMRKQIGMTRALGMQDDFEAHTSALVRELGEERFDEAWVEGSMMTLEQAVAYAVEAMA